MTIHSTAKNNTNSTQELTGRTAVVTGASSGIGRAIALELAAAGADVLIHANTSKAAAEEVAKEVEQLGGKSLVALGDLEDPSFQDELVRTAWAWRPVDIWINNAGADVLTGEAASLSFEAKLELLWKVDVVATMRLSRAVGQKMQERKQGVLLNMGWDQAFTGMAGESGELFAATKGAIMAFSQSLAKSLAPSVRVHCLAPGWIKTQWGETASEAWQAKAVEESLAARWGTPQDVASVARFLVSDAASFLNGQIFYVNGGRI